MRFNKTSGTGLNQTQSHQSVDRSRTPHNSTKESTLSSNSKNKRRQTKSLIKPNLKPVNITSSPNGSSKRILSTTVNNGSFVPLKLQAIKQYGNNVGYRYFSLGKGNNHQMVKRILQLRRGWIQTGESSQPTPEQFIPSVVSFRWAQSAFGFKYQNLGKDCLCFNHFQYHRELSNKQRLVWNMINYCETNKLNAFDYLPLTYVIDLASGEQDTALRNFLKFYNRNIPPNTKLSKMQSITLPKIKYPQQSTVHLRRSSQGNFYCKSNMPKTFVCDDQPGGSSYLWILKPTFLNRGRGIALFSSLQQFEKLIWKLYRGEDLEDYGNKVGLDEYTTGDQTMKEEEDDRQEQKKKLKIQSQSLGLTQSSSICLAAKQVILGAVQNSTVKVDTIIEKGNAIEEKQKKSQFQQVTHQKNKQAEQSEKQTKKQEIATSNKLQIKQESSQKQQKQTTKTKQQPVQSPKQTQQQASLKKNQSVIVVTTDKQPQSTPNPVNSSTTVPQSQPNPSSKTTSPPIKVLSFVVQKYIESPMLINQRKFDIRVWAMLTPSYEVYFFKQGYLRFSSYKYSTKQHNNPFIHLTNNSVQKHSADYNEESGNQVYLSEGIKAALGVGGEGSTRTNTVIGESKQNMENSCKSSSNVNNETTSTTTVTNPQLNSNQSNTHTNSQNSYNRIQSKMRQIVWLTMMSVRRKININARKQCFEIFGYDFMLDSSYKLWLIQINTNPAIDDNSTLLKQLVPRMLDDAFKLTIDKLFDNKLGENHPQFPVQGYKNDENMWELLGDFRDGLNNKAAVIDRKKVSGLRR